MSEVRQMPSEKSLAGDYARRLLKAIGTAVQAPDGSVAAADFLADGDELAIVDELIEETYDQFFLSTATWLLSGYERIYGLAISPELTDAQRQALLVSKARAARSASPSDISKAISNLTTVTILENRYVDLPASQKIGVYVFAVKVDQAAFDNSATWSVIERVVQQMKPAHMQGNVCVTAAFQCDDPNSLTDRDVLES